MSEHITCRFEENQHYDIMLDAEVVTLMCITDIGTYHGTLELGTSSQLRNARAEFKDYVLRCIERGAPPHEVEFD